MFDQYIQFASHHPFLVGPFIVLLLLWATYESRRSQSDTVSPGEATTLINRSDAQVVDLRDPKEFKKGFISGAVNIPKEKLETRIGELDKYKQNPIILVCKTGQTSAAAAQTLAKNGFATVKRLRGGMAQWQADDLPTVTRSK